LLRAGGWRATRSPDPTTGVEIEQPAGNMARGWRQVHAAD